MARFLSRLDGQRGHWLVDVYDGWVSFLLCGVAVIAWKSRWKTWALDGERVFAL